MIYTFTITGAPRTKKTHGRIIKLRGSGRPKLLPSEAHEAWFANAMTQVVLIQRHLITQGLTQAIDKPVAVAALFYRERDSGDLCGYLQALGDFLQEPRLKPRRNGAGIIKDDSQIVSWDGSRLRKDADSPRIEVEVQVLENYKS